MRLTCILSFIAAVVLGVLLFGNGAASILAVHVAFILMVATFVASAIAIIRGIVASQVKWHTDPAIPRVHNDPDEETSHATGRHNESRRRDAGV